MLSETSPALRYCQELFPDIESPHSPALLAIPVPYFKMLSWNRAGNWPKSGQKSTGANKDVYCLNFIYFYHINPPQEPFSGRFIFYHNCCGNNSNSKKKSFDGSFLWFFWHTRGKLGWRLKTEDWRLKAEGKATRKKARFVPAHQPPSTKAGLKTRTTVVHELWP